MTLDSEVIIISKEEIASKSFTIQTHIPPFLKYEWRDHLVTLIISLSFWATN